MYGQLEKLPPSLVGGINPDLFLTITLEEIDIEGFVPPYHGPAVVVRARTKDSTETIIDKILEVRREDTKPFERPDRNGKLETMEEAIMRKQVETSTRIAHYLDAYGVSREAVAAVVGADFREWANNVLQLLPEGYEEQPVSVIMTFNNKNYLSTPRYLKGRGWGAFVADSPSKLRVMPKHIVVNPAEGAGNGAGASSPADPW